MLLVLCLGVFLNATRTKARQWFTFTTPFFVQIKVPFTYDALLGWVPPAEKPGLPYPWGTVRTLKDGARANGNARVPNSAPRILAVGDSFTFGDGVRDKETWPSALERKLKRPVLNAGVYGYGVDQSFLRASKLIREFHPRTVIFSLIDDDIQRAEHTVLGGNPKPHFILQDGLLVHEIYPAPHPGQRFKGMLFPWLLESPYVTAYLANQPHPALLKWARYTEKGKERGGDLFCAMLKQMDHWAASPELEVVVMLQYYLDFTGYGAQQERMHEALNCAQPKNISVLDLRPALSALHEADLTRFNSLFDSQMTAAGNEWVADRLSEHLARASSALQ